jgi:hypothetical protein
MTEPTVATEVRGLLAAIVASLNVPFARRYRADEAARDRLLSWRTSAVRIAVEGVLAGDYTAARAAALLADHTAESPVVYATAGGAR